MKLKITTPESNGHFMSGAMANIFLDDVDVSRYVHRVVLTVDAEEAICAEVTLYLTAVELDVPAAIETLLIDSQERAVAVAGARPCQQ